MNTIKVIYTDSISALYNKLNRRHFNIEKISKEEMNVAMRDEDEFKEFIEVLNKYLIKENFTIQSKRILQKKGYGDDFLKALLAEEIIKNIHKLDYFNVLTEILLLEYFKNMDTINLKSFMTFNMRGFNDEALLIVEMAEKHIQERMLNEGYGEDDEDIAYIDDVANALATLVENRVLKKEDFEELGLIIAPDNKVQITDLNGNVHTMESFSNMIGMELSYASDTGDTGDTILQMSLLFTSVILSIMATKKVYVSKKAKNFTQMLKAYFEAMNISAVIEEV